MRSISRLELEQMLAKLRGATPVTFIARTEPKFKGGKSSPMSGIQKASKVNAMLNFDYEKAVNRVKVKEGDTPDFKAQERSWGTRETGIGGTIQPIIENKGQKYLQVKVQKSLGHSYYRGHKRVANEVVEPHLYTSPNGDKGRQDVENPVIVRTYKLDNIRAINLKGESYVVT